MCWRATTACRGWCWTRPSRTGGRACPFTCRSSPTSTMLWPPWYDGPRAGTTCLDISISLSCGAMVGLYGKCLLAGQQKVLLNEISSNDYCLSKCSCDRSVPIEILKLLIQILVAGSLKSFLGNGTRGRIFLPYCHLESAKR